MLYTEEHMLAACALQHTPQSMLDIPSKMLGLSPMEPDLGDK